MAFGLVSSINTKDYWSLNYRRKVFRQFPTGAAPLMGLLSMLPDGEHADKPEFGWHETRFPTQMTTTVATGTAPFRDTSGAALADLTPLTANVEYRLIVASTDQFRPTHVIEIRDVSFDDVTTAGLMFNVQAVVTQIISSTVLQFRPTTTFGTASHGVDNATVDNVSKNVAIIGTANRENARSGVGISRYPIQASNFTQIFRTAFNISRTSLKGGLKYDSSGPYKNMAWDNGLNHMIELEKAFLWGRKAETNVADPETNEATPEKKTGGIMHFLEQWEAADSVYRGGTGVAALVANTEDNKRIIDLGGTLSKSDMNTYIDRAFKFTNSKAYEKLALCGGKFLTTVNQLFERDIVRETMIASKDRDWEFIVHSHTTLRGTIHYKVHPLLDIDPDWTDGAMILDMGNLRYRPLSDSDTEFLKGRQETDRDGRKDEWITESGLELRFPESFMAIKNATAPA